jgi:hypothetical protein
MHQILQLIGPNVSWLYFRGTSTSEHAFRDSDLKRDHHNLLGHFLAMDGIAITPVCS